MKKVFVTTLLLACFTMKMFAQNSEPSFNSYHKNVYAELFGSSLLVGVNYDMRLNKGRLDGIGFRVGVGGVNISPQNQVNISSQNQLDNTTKMGIVTFPLEVNYLIGKKRSSFVTGAGLLPVYAFVQTLGTSSNYEYIRKEGFALIGGFLNLGYRFQPKKTGLMFQANWNPLILRGTGFNAGWIGLGIGIGFK